MRCRVKATVNGQIIVSLNQKYALLILSVALNPNSTKLRNAVKSAIIKRGSSD
jgi:hypothetical protein